MDLFLFKIINNLAGKWVFLDFLGVFFAKYSEYVLWLILVCLVLIKFKKYWKMIVEAMVSGILARFVITNIIRWIWSRPRPFNILENINLLLPQKTEPSFPSGHASFYFAISTVVYLYNKKLGYLFFAVTFLMGLARVFVGYHWPFDILAGAVIGIFSGLVVFYLPKKFLKV